MDYRYDEDRKKIYDPDENKKKFGAGTVLRWIIYSVCIFTIAAVAFRLVTTGPPGELKNYIIKSESVKKAREESGNGLTVYKIDVRNSFSLGDALYIESVYYIESAENLQVTLRLRNGRFEELGGESPFWPLLSVGIRETERDENTGPAVTAEPSDEYSVGKTSDRYRYFVYSFDGVKIDYVNSVIRLYIFIEGDAGFPDEGYSIARFTIFDINMPKSKAPAKNFGLG